MSFDVDAFMGMPAAPPPVRAEAPQASDGPSFDDHLDEVTAEPEVETKPIENKAKETPEQPDQPAAAPAAPAPPPQPQAPIVIQLIADAPPTTEAPVEADATAETPELAPQAPSTPAPIAPVKAEATKSETPQPTAEAPVAPVETTQTKNDAPAKSDAPVKAETAKADAPVVDDTPEVQPTQAQAPPPQQPEAPPQPQLIAQAAPAPAPVQRVAPSVETEPSNTGDAAPEAPILDAPDDKRTVKADAEPRADAPKANAAPSANTKDSFAAVAALAAQDGGEQMQAPSTPASAIAGTELTPQSSQVTAENVARAAPAAAQVSREIIRRFNGQTTSFELRLDPPELGKVEVRLEVSRDHKVTAVVAAENPAALAELARHARDLQQALQSAGLDLSDKGLSFDLKQQRESRADSEGGSSRSNTGGQEAASTSTPTPSRPIGLESWRGVRVDLVA